jgi:hypothetical protein
MGISEKLEEMATEKERERGVKDIKKLFNYLENFEVEGLNEVLTEIKDLCESGSYKRLIKAYELENEIPKDRVFTVDEALNVPILKLADENLWRGGLLTTIFIGSLVTAKQIFSIYSFIEYTYCIFADRPTNWNDNLNISFSGLDERIIFALDKFDEVELEDLPEPTTDYFQMLRRVKWKDKKAKKTYDKLTRLMFEMRELVLDYPNLSQSIKKFSTYGATEDLFIRTIAGCSAVNDNRLEIEAEDVVRAYKTFFKLIKTDVTKYKAIPELVQDIDGYRRNVKNDGYLVCNKCNGYYQLQPGESPEDFEECQCGGKLKYYEDIDWLLEKKEDSK